jgi:hypothetical protein
VSFFATKFDASKVAPQEAFKPLPDGEYQILITKCKEELTRDGTGLLLHYEGQVVDGPCKGRVIHDRITLRNKNPTAVEIGQRQLSALCHATGIMVPTGAHVFVQKVIRIKVKVVARKDKPGEMANEVAGIILPEAKPAAAASTLPPSTAPAGDAPAWG